MDLGRPVTVSAPTTPELKRFVDQLVKRTEKIKSGKVDPRDDNMLKITTDVGGNTVVALGRWLHQSF